MAKGKSKGEAGKKGEGKDKEDGVKSEKKKKGKGAGKGEPPAKLAGEGTLWEEPRSTTGLAIIGESTLPPGARWHYILKDESRRSYAGYMPSPLNQGQCQQFFERIREGTEWQQPESRIPDPLNPGMMLKIPRKTFWCVKEGCQCHYCYGGIQVSPVEYPPWMLELMRTVMPYYGLKNQMEWPDCCNVNLYEDGCMAVGWHSDDERLFQGKFRDIRILSLSFGVSRSFELRLNFPDAGERSLYRIKLNSGDLMSMEGMAQKHTQHRVPKEENIREPRINLTWRWIVKHEPYCPVGRQRW